MPNKIKFGLKNVTYFMITEVYNPSAGTWSTNYGSGKKIPGAVNLSLDPVGGEKTDFFADDGVYATTSSANKGYDGSLEIAMLPDSARKDLLGETEDSNGVVIESRDNQAKKFAMAFEIQGDQKKRKYILYNCELSKPSISAQTKEDATEPQTDTLNIQARPRVDADAYIQAHSGENTSTSILNSWDSTVYIPTGTPTITYEEVTPVGTENPSEEGWFYKDGTQYYPTMDTEVVSGKTYYEVSED